MGELTATPEAIRAAHAAGVQVIEAVLRHLGGDVGAAASAANKNAVATGGCLRSVYRLPGTCDALIVTTNADRRRTTAALASQSDTGRCWSCDPFDRTSSTAASAPPEAIPSTSGPRGSASAAGPAPRIPGDSAARAAERAELTAHVASSGPPTLP